MTSIAGVLLLIRFTPGYRLDALMLLIRFTTKCKLRKSVVREGWLFFFLFITWDEASGMRHYWVVSLCGIMSILAGEVSSTVCPQTACILNFKLHIYITHTHS